MIDTDADVQSGEAPATTEDLSQPAPPLAEERGERAKKGLPSCGNQLSSLRESLRSGTAAAHHALDHQPLLQRLLSSGLTRQLYAESLAAIYRPHVRLERQVHASRHFAECGMELAPRRAQLAADLTELGWPTPTDSRAPLEPAKQRAAWWGQVYVLKGSRLGAAVIAKRVRNSLGEAVPCRFFGQASSPGAFAALVAVLERALEAQVDFREANLKLAISSAQAAFANYKSELDAFDGSWLDISEWGGRTE